MSRGSCALPWATPRNMPIFSCSISLRPPMLALRPASLATCLRRLRQPRRGHHVGRLVDQVPRPVGGLGHAAAQLHRLLERRALLVPSGSTSARGAQPGRLLVLLARRSCTGRSGRRPAAGPPPRRARPPAAAPCPARRRRARSAFSFCAVFAARPGRQPQHLGAGSFARRPGPAAARARPPACPGCAARGTDPPCP